MSIGHVNPELAKKLPLDRIAELCRKYHVVELSVFGSFLRDDFGPESDIDLLAIFQDDDYGPWMGDLLPWSKSSVRHWAGKWISFRKRASSEARIGYEGPVFSIRPR